jgi:uracil-DNA glycosylase
MPTEIEKLFKKASQLNYDNSCGMVKVDEMQGAGFFPGCYGTSDTKSNSNNKFVMVLGQDFDTYANYQRLTKKGEVDSNTTWRNLKILLKDIHIDENICFFTNVYMGLRKEGVKNTGPSPATKSKSFVGECSEFFKDQLTAIKPEIVFVLGKETAKFLAIVFPQLEDWERVDTLKSLYKNGRNTYYDLKFNSMDIMFLLVIHPSMSNTNRSLIFGKENKGQEVETLKKQLSKFYKRHNILNF